MFMTDRRLLLAALSASLLPPRAFAAVGAPAGHPAGAAAGLSALRAWWRAPKKTPASPIKRQQPRAAEIIKGIDFDAAQKIKFRADHALWRGAAAYPVAFFHLSRYSDRAGGAACGGRTARRARFSTGPTISTMAPAGWIPSRWPSWALPGFRVMDGQTKPTDWLAFQGASYFRSSGQDEQYGASARGIAINTAAADGGRVSPLLGILAGRERPGGQRLCPAGRALHHRRLQVRRHEECSNGAVVMNVHCDLFFRADISRLGVAPLTSMYWYGENERRKAADWRPEIHDNDGLALWTGKGERIWRPLINPPQVQTNSFADNNPKGFGLMQRDRDFANYQDDGAFYNKRPGIWVEPKGNWGAGAVQLVEIPTEDETHDNIVAYWRPDGDIQERRQPVASTIASIGRTANRLIPKTSPRWWRRGWGAAACRAQIPGRATSANSWSISPAARWRSCSSAIDLTPVVNASRGKIDNAYVIKVVGTDRWRALFDLQVDGNAAGRPALFLKLGDKTLSETWLYQYFP